MSKREAIGVVLVIAALAAACGGGSQPTAPTEKVTASDGQTQLETGGVYGEAMIEPLAGQSIKGMAIFAPTDDGKVRLTLDVSGAPAGPLAAHIHEHGDCSAPDGSSAGAHWNPTSDDHGQWEHSPFHLGDLGNLTIDAQGRGQVEIVTDRWTIGTGATNDVVGKSIIVHEKADDFTTQPTGAAGGRIACGVIARK